MPKALAVDWEAAKALYIKGLSVPVISEQLGIPQPALRQRVVRHKWAQVKTESEQAVSRVVVKGLKERAETWVNEMDQYIHDVLKDLRERGVGGTKPRDLADLIKAAATANGIARQNYGMDAETSHGPRTSLVQVVVHTTPSTSTPLRMVQSGSAIQPTIDVDSCSVSEEKSEDN